MLSYYKQIKWFYVLHQVFMNMNKDYSKRQEYQIINLD